MCPSCHEVHTLVSAAGLTLTADEVAALAEGYVRLRRSVDALYAVTTADEDAHSIPLADPPRAPWVDGLAQ